VLCPDKPRWTGPTEAPLGTDLACTSMTTWKTTAPPKVVAPAMPGLLHPRSSPSLRFLKAVHATVAARASRHRSLATPSKGLPRRRGGCITWAISPQAEFALCGPPMQVGRGITAIFGTALTLHTCPVLELYMSCNYIQSYLELFNIWNTSLWKYTCIYTWNYSTYLLWN
jgi:hypothetical protein